MNPTPATVLVCHDCPGDTYHPRHQQIIEVLTTGTCAQFTNTPQQNELYALKAEARQFRVEQCRAGILHLFQESNKVLMVREAYNLIQQLHCDNHISGQTMLDVLSRSPIHIQSIYNLVMEFPYTCGVCLTQGLRPETCISPYWIVLEKRFNVNLRHVLKEESIEETLKNLPVKVCPSDACVRDYYDREYQVCMYIIENKTFPPLPKGEGSLINHIRLKKKAKQLVIIPCNYHTNHLWAKEINLRIPMVKESKELAQLLHGENAHRPQKIMKELLFNKQNKVYPHDMKMVIQEVVADCQVCNPKTADVDSDSQSDPMQEMEMSSSKFNKTPYARMGLQKKVEYTKQIMQTEKLREKAARIKKYLDSLEIWEDPNKYLARISNDNNISTFAAELAIDNLHWSRTDDDLLEDNILNVPGVIFRSYKEQEITKVMLISTQPMRYNYYKYGEVLHIDYISGVCRRREASGRHYMVGFFTGQNHAKNLVIFGATMISTEMALYHLKSYELFIEAMGGGPTPGSIVTPDSRPLSLSLEMHKKMHNLEYECYVNWFYVVEFLKKNSGQQLEKETILDLFCRAISEPIPAVYHDIMQTIKSQIVSTNIHKQIEKVGDKFCLSRIVPRFVGCGIASSRVENLYEMLEAKLFYQLKIGAFFSNLFRIDKGLEDSRAESKPQPLTIDQIKQKLHMIEISRNDLDKDFPHGEANNHNKGVGGQKIVNELQMQQEGPECNIEAAGELHQLQLMSELLHPEVFKQLLLNYYKSLPRFLKVSSLDPQHLYYTLIDNKPKNKCVYVVRYFVQQFCWRCNCNVYYFTGIPCSHLIRVLLIHKASLQYYTNSRWIVSSIDSEFKYEHQSQSARIKIEDRASNHLSARNKSSEDSRSQPSGQGSFGLSQNIKFQASRASPSSIPFIPNPFEPELHQAERVPNFSRLLKYCTEQILNQDRGKNFQPINQEDLDSSEEDHKQRDSKLMKKEQGQINMKAQHSANISQRKGERFEKSQKQKQKMKKTQSLDDDEVEKNSKLRKLDSDESSEEMGSSQEIGNGYGMKVDNDMQVEENGSQESFSEE